MRRTHRGHVHQCQRCGAETDCSGELVANDDGFPVVICRSFHLDGGQVDDEFLCQDCRDVVNQIAWGAA